MKKIYILSFILLVAGVLSAATFINGRESFWPVESNGAVPVNIQDQTSKPFAFRMADALTGPYILAADTVIDGYEFELTNATGLSVNDQIGIFQDSTNPCSFFAYIKSISSNTITVNIPIPCVFSNGNSAVLFEVANNAAVDGSTTRRIFTVSNNSTIDIDITRVIIKMITSTQGELTDFGDLSTLTNGIVLRHKKSDGTYENIMTARNNSELSLHAYDYTVYDAANPGQGVYGSLTRFTFAGQDKLGVAIRIAEEDALELLIQDDISGLIDLKVMAEGHYVTD